MASGSVGSRGAHKRKVKRHWYKKMLRKHRHKKAKRYGKK